MQKVYVIGTIHGGYVPQDELREELAKLKPTQLLLELPDKSLKEIKRSDDIRDEMMCAYEWATKNKVPVYCFDTNRNTFRKGITINSPVFKKLIDYQLMMLKSNKISWKDFNKKKNDSFLDHPLEDKVSDPVKLAKRDKEMLENIQKHMVSDGNIVILTGAGHLPFFEKELSEAIFPFRNS